MMMMMTDPLLCIGHDLLFCYGIITIFVFMALLIIE